MQTHQLTSQLLGSVPPPQPSSGRGRGKEGLSVLSCLSLLHSQPEFLWSSSWKISLLSSAKRSRVIPWPHGLGLESGALLLLIRPFSHSCFPPCTAEQFSLFEGAWALIPKTPQASGPPIQLFHISGGQISAFTARSAPFIQLFSILPNLVDISGLSPRLSFPFLHLSCPSV